MGMFDTLQEITRGKSEAEAEQFINDLHDRIGGRSGAYEAGLKATGASSHQIFARSLRFRLRSFFQRFWRA